MAAASHPSIPEIQPGRIYRKIVEKRRGDRRVDDGGGPLGKAELEAARVEDGELRFESRGAQSRAFADGIFYLLIPDDIDVSAGDDFSRQFYRGSSTQPYGHFRDSREGIFGDPLLGFHQRVSQIEQFLLERRFWGRHFPREITVLGERLTLLSQQVLRAVLTHAGVPGGQWRQATGGCSDAAGSYHLTFNHYRPQVEQIGLNSHKDDGFVTILRTTSPGLEVSRKEFWETVPTDPRYFVVNFGLSTEILTVACEAPVAAIMHRVKHQDADRSSFGHFSSSQCEPGNDDGVYRYLPGTGLTRVCGSRELIDANDHEIYQGTELDEGGIP